jgi:hypothetical protein
MKCCGMTKKNPTALNGLNIHQISHHQIQPISGLLLFLVLNNGLHPLLFVFIPFGNICTFLKDNLQIPNYLIPNSKKRLTFHSFC